MTDIPKSIYRRDNAKNKGWVVRLHYGDEETETKYFSDNAHGGDAGSLDAARNWLNDLLAERPAPLFIYSRKTIASNSSGHNGLSFTHTIGKDGEEIPCINVSYSLTPGKPKQKRFYYHHYETDDAAVQDAREFRRTMDFATIRHRKLHRMRPFDGAVNFCMVPTCLYRIPDGEKFCRYHKGTKREK